MGSISIAARVPTGAGDAGGESARRRSSSWTTRRVSRLVKDDIYAIVFEQN
jgi:hypothetical protein